MNEQEVREVRIEALNAALQIKESQDNGGYFTNEVIESASQIEKYITKGR